MSAFEKMTDLLIEQGVRGKTVRAILGVWMDREGVPASSIRRYSNYPEILAVFAERGVRLPSLEGGAGSFTEKAFGVTVRRQRESVAWTQQQLRARLFADYGIDLSKTAMSRLENGDRPVRLNEAAALAHVLGIELRLGGEPS